MISVDGTVRGRLDKVVFVPSQARFVGPLGEQIVYSRVYADVRVDEETSTVKVWLADNTEMLSDLPWYWLAIERATNGTYITFIFPSDTATLNYADIRPVGGT